MLYYQLLWNEAEQKSAFRGGVGRMSLFKEFIIENTGDVSLVGVVFPSGQVVVEGTTRASRDELTPLEPHGSPLGIFSGLEQVVKKFVSGRQARLRWVDPAVVWLAEDSAVVSDELLPRG